MEIKGFMPFVIGLAILFVFLWLIGGVLSFLASNPIVLVLIIAGIGGAVYFWMKRHRSRTTV